MEKMFRPQNLSEIIKIADEKIKSSPDKKIESPFETKISPDSINAESLKLMSKLKIEVMIRKNDRGEFIFSTSKTDSVVYGFPEEALPEKPLDPSDFPTISNYMDAIEVERGVMSSLIHLQKEVGDSSSTIHSHPSQSLIDILKKGKDSCAPSPNDINISRKSNTKNDFVISEYGICKFKTPKSLPDEELGKVYRMSKLDYEVYLQFLIDKKIVQKVARFESPEIEDLIREFKDSI